MKNEKGIMAYFRQDRKIMLIALGSGILAVFLIFLYLDSKKEPYGPLIPALVASADVEKGSSLSKSLIEVKNIPEQLIPPNYIIQENLASIIDQKTIVPISAGQPILWTFIQTGEIISGLAEKLAAEHNERAVTIVTDEISSVAGHIRLNDRVDVIGTFIIPSNKPDAPPVTRTKTILQCVTVLAVGAAGTEQAQQIGFGGAPTSVTLKVKPEEAELLAFAEQIGKLRLLLRNQDDLKVDEEIPVVDFSNLFEIEKQQTRSRKDYIKIIYGK